MPLSFFSRREGSDWRITVLCKSVILGLLLVLTLQPSLAQANLADWANVENLVSDSEISVSTRAGAKYHGTFVRAIADSLTIASDERSFRGRVSRARDLKREQIREVRLGARVKSMLSSSAIGAGVGAGIGVGLDSTAKSHEYRGVPAVTLAFLGAAIGAAVGLHNPVVKAKKIYVAP